MEKFPVTAHLHDEKERIIMGALAPFYKILY
jgi:hypothetical protein